MDDQAPNLKALIKTVAKSSDAAGVQRTEKQLAQLTLEDRAAFVREQIFALNNILDEARRRGAPYAINVGRALLVTKAELRHGEFGEWIERKCKLALSTAKLYMLLARHADELKKKGVNLNDTSVRAMRAMITEGQHKAPQKLLGRPRGTAPDSRASSNNIQRCVLLLHHLLDHGDQNKVEAELLPELLHAVSELKKRKTRRAATRAD
jgi:hypothetical protein